MLLCRRRTADDCPCYGLVGPGRTLKVYLPDTVVIDSGARLEPPEPRATTRWPAHHRPRATHAHFDHAGSSAWLCRTLGVPLWCGAGDVDAIISGRVDTHGSPLFNRLQCALLHVTAHPVTRALGEGDIVGGFEVLEVPGHSPGALASWRARDRVLICGDVLGNFALRPERIRLVQPPAALSSDVEENRRSVRRLTELRPRLVCFGHGFAVADPGRFKAAVEQILQQSA